MGFSARQLATRISVKPATLEKWERDISEPRANKLVTLAGILGVPVLWLLNGKVPVDADHGARPSQTSATARKLERAVAMQGELAALLVDISADLSRLQRGIDDTQDMSQDTARDAAA